MSSMLPDLFYLPLKALHLLGILLIFLAYGVTIAHAYLLGDNATLRRLTGISSGIGLLLVLLTGLLLLGFLSGPLAWVLVKLAVWVALGAGTVWINRCPARSLLAYYLVLLLGLIAILSVLFRPF